MIVMHNERQLVVRTCDVTTWCLSCPWVRSTRFAVDDADTNGAAQEVWRVKLKRRQPTNSLQRRDDGGRQCIIRLYDATAIPRLDFRVVKLQHWNFPPLRRTGSSVVGFYSLIIGSGACVYVAEDVSCVPAMRGTRHDALEVSTWACGRDVSLLSSCYCYV